ncbi:MAG: hypothetical protein M5U12_24635 [Verrucomicrobia bacterium]|nr:hypothetical protein [Verrucomicrobiota bacterium]
MSPSRRGSPLIYPQPDETVIVDNVRVSGRSLYLIPAAGNTVPQLARALVGGPHGVRQPQGASPDVRRVELWAKPTATTPTRLVAVVGEYDVAALSLEQTDHGAMLVLSTSGDGHVESLGATWFLGAPPPTQPPTGMRTACPMAGKSDTSWTRTIRGTLPWTRMAMASRTSSNI